MSYVQRDGSRNLTTSLMKVFMIRVVNSSLERFLLKCNTKALDPSLYIITELKELGQ